MPLAPYSERYWYTNEMLAVGAMAHVFPRFSNVHALLFQDQAGTVPLPNPLPVGPDGFLSFFATNGDYWIFVNGQAFYVIIDLDPNLTHVWPSTFRWVQDTAQSVWTIDHGLSSKPAVITLNTADEIILGTVEYQGDNALTITFGTPVAGVAYLRR